MGCLPSKTHQRILSFKPEFKTSAFKPTLQDEIQEINEIFSLSLVIENNLIEFKMNEAIDEEFGSEIEIQVEKCSAGEVKSMVLKFKE